ncbi:hypothetical protein LP414_22325 [Polaromonas sp. P1(28)-13]|nr:hypothetical protein LP414_22325 [Polaromonas sp. P1(28)-13]
MPHFHAASPRWQQLITPAWLARLVAGASVSAAPANGWRLLEVDCGAPGAFLQSHIPGAAYLDTQCLEEGPFWNKVSDSALLQLLLGLGIRHDTTVVLYGRNTTAAARAAHLMLYAGVKDVRLLDGGFTAWLRAGPALCRRRAATLPTRRKLWRELSGLSALPDQHAPGEVAFIAA